jgi:hypothetical protein
MNLGFTLQVAVKKICNVFDNVADATRILREIKLLRLLKHAGVEEEEHRGLAQLGIQCWIQPTVMGPGSLGKFEFIRTLMPSLLTAAPSSQYPSSSGAYSMQVHHVAMGLGMGVWVLPPLLPPLAGYGMR